jgi:hypothetical protein
LPHIAVAEPGYGKADFAGRFARMSGKIGLMPSCISLCSKKKKRERSRYGEPASRLGNRNLRARSSHAPATE